MTQLESYKVFIRENGHQLHLGHILGTPAFCAEYRKLHTFLRRRGWTVTCKKNGPAHGRNLYTFLEPGQGVPA